MVVAQHRVVLVNEYVTKGLGSMNRQIDSTAKSHGKLNQAMTNTTKKSKNMLASMTKMRWAMVNVAMAAALVYGAFKLLVQPAIEFETELANVQKTTGFTTDEMAGLATELRGLSTIVPVTAVELAQIATVAGQLGIGAKAGVDGITSFTVAISMITTAMDMTAEEAASSMAKIAQSFQIPINQVANLGSVINELENTTAAKGSEIVNSLRRVGAAASTLGISFEQSAASVTTLISAGMRAERAGTRLRSLFNSMASNAQEFADIAGVSVTDFRMALETDADQALQMVIEGLNNTSLRTEKMKDALDAAGKVGGFALITLADNAEEFGTNMATANEAILDANSLIEEMGIKAETTAGQWKILTNTIKEKFLDEKGWVSDFVAGARMWMEEGSVADFLSILMGDVTRPMEIAERMEATILDEAQALREVAKEAGMTKDEIAEMMDSILVNGRRMPYILDEIRNRIELLKGTADTEEILPPKRDLEDVREELEKIAEEEGQLKERQASLSDLTYEYRLRLNELQRELKNVGKELTSVRKDISKTNDEISNILSRRFMIRGVSETEIGNIIAMQELELQKAKFAALGLGTAEDFLRNATLLTSEEIQNQTESIKKLSKATEDGQDEYDAWKTTLQETIRALLMSSQDIDRDVTTVVRKAQTELLSITRFDREKGDQFTQMEDNLDVLRMAQGIFFGEEQEQLRYSEALREDRINGMNESASVAIANLSEERNTLNQLLSREEYWIDMQNDIRNEMDKNKRKIDEITAAYYRQRKELENLRMAESKAGRSRTPTPDAWEGLREEAENARPGETAGDIIRRWREKYGMSDFISRPGERAVPFSPDDTIVGVKDISKLSGPSIGAVTININGYNRDQRTLAIEVKRQLASLA